MKTMKKGILSWIKVFFKFLLLLLRKYGGDRKLLDLVTDVLEDADNFVTYHYRPKLSNAVMTESDLVKGRKPLAIVMQGPIVHVDSFTLETLKIYQRHFAGANIIVSTWEDESPVAIRQIEDAGIMVVLNRKPAYPGVSNINLQIASSRSGMQQAKDLGAEYALKTRTDQRMYAPNLTDFFYNLTEIFPVNGNWPKQRKRIVGCSLNTFKYRMYGLSDMLIYGHIDDMLVYWDIGLDERVFDEKQQLQATSSLRTFALWRVCEVYLATEFLMKIGRELEWSLRDSWSVFAEHFCVVDKEQLDLFWPKYNHSEYRWLGYSEDTRMQEVSFREWVNLYASLTTREIPESMLDAPFK